MPRQRMDKSRKGSGPPRHWTDEISKTLDTRIGEGIKCQRRRGRQVATREGFGPSLSGKMCQARNKAEGTASSQRDEERIVELRHGKHRERDVGRGDITRGWTPAPCRLGKWPGKTRVRSDLPSSHFTSMGGKNEQESRALRESPS